MADMLGHGRAADRLAAAPLVDVAGSQAAAGFGFNVLYIDVDRARRRAEPVYLRDVRLKSSIIQPRTALSVTV